MRHAVLAMIVGLIGCGAGGGTGDDGDDDNPPLTGDKYELRWGPLTVQPGTESTQCVDIRLSNTTPIKVHQMHNLLGPGSHHLIVYKNDDPTVIEQASPYDCTPFTGALNLNGMIAPVMITQRSDDALTLPRGVAYTFEANQMIRIEMHFINATDAVMTAQATAEFYAAEEDSIQHEADILFIGSPDINIAPGGTQVLEQYFTPFRAGLDLNGARFFAITGHTHHYGTDMQVALKTGPLATTQTSIYAPTPFVWSEPETTRHRPEFEVPDGGGFNFKCAYHNTGTEPVTFGESANDEMCFFWTYYYPSRGSHVCVQYRGVDICCPDAGDLCRIIEDML